MKIVALLAPVILLGIGSSSQSDLYFEFDTVEHFQTDYKKFEKDGESIYLKVARNKQEEDLLKVLRSQKVSFQDTALIKRLDRLGFDKSVLSLDEVDQLKGLFAPKKLRMDETTFCEPIYNDILVFRNNNKIAGYAKVCFSCGKMIIVGDNLIDKISSGNENFLKLENLLNK